MRILHVTPYGGEAWAYGGIPRVVAAVTRGLARRGHQVTICTTDACDERSRLPAIARHEDGVDVRVFRNLSNRLAYHLQFFLPLGLDSYLRDHAHMFDVAHLHACRNMPGVMAARRLTAARVPYVLSPHGTLPIVERRFVAKRVFDALGGSRVVDGAARLVAVSSAERTQCLDAGCAPSRVVDIPNPVDDAPVGARTRTANQRPTVLYLGKITPRKRVDLLVRAFAMIAAPDVALTIAGNDMGAANGVRRLVQDLHLDTRVTWPGLIRGDARFALLAAADVLVYPSEHEVFGLVPLEALLAGTPVIVADDSGCGDIIREIGGGLVVAAGDAHALAGAIDAVLSEPERWRREATAAAAHVRSNFAVDSVCEQLEHVYRSVVTA